MAQIDTSTVLLADTTIGKTDRIKLRVEVYWDEQTAAHRIKVTDERTDTDAHRMVTEGRTQDGRIPVESVIAKMPEILEEVIILNKLMGVV